MGQEYIGRYRVLGKLGKGGMGTVVRAMDEAREREVAIKLPNDTDPDDLRRLQQECDVLIQLQHRHIVEVYGSGSTSDVPLYLVMEFVDGQTVEQLLQQSGGRLEPRQALQIALGVAEALAYAHRPPLRVIHRDIKPANVLIRQSDGMVKVTDFGVAAVLAQKSGRTAIGTLWYMAPEQAMSQGADERSDLYSLGAMLYEMLTGQRPPQFALGAAQPPSLWLGSMPPAMSARSDALVLGLLRADRTQRQPQRAAEVAEELRALLENRPARRLSSPTPDPNDIHYAPTRRSAPSLPGAAPLPPTQRASRPPAATHPPTWSGSPTLSGPQPGWSYPPPSGPQPTPAPYAPPAGYLPRSRRARVSAFFGAIALDTMLAYLLGLFLAGGNFIRSGAPIFLAIAFLAGLGAIAEGYYANRDVREGKRVDPKRIARSGIIGGTISLILLGLAIVLTLDISASIHN